MHVSKTPAPSFRGLHSCEASAARAELKGPGAPYSPSLPRLGPTRTGASTPIAMAPRALSLQHYKGASASILNLGPWDATLAEREPHQRSQSSGSRLLDVPTFPPSQRASETAPQHDSMVRVEGKKEPTSLAAAPRNASAGQIFTCQPVPGPDSILRLARCKITPQKKRAPVLLPCPSARANMVCLHVKHSSPFPARGK